MNSLSGFHRESAKISLTGAEVHVWLAEVDEVNDQRIYELYRNIMSAEERDQEGRFRFTRDRRRYVLTRALVRSVLSMYAPVAPKDWSFEVNKYGRPQIKNSDACKDRLLFNVSSAAGASVIAVSREALVGIDLEDVRRALPVGIPLFNILGKPEAQEVSSLREEQRASRFLEYWTLKEAYLKARGVGLTFALDAFQFHIIGRKIRLSVNPMIGDDAERWQFVQFRALTSYVLALCVERLQLRRSPDVTLRLSVPLVDEREIMLTSVRTSL